MLLQLEDNYQCHMLDSEYPKRFKQQDILIGWLEYVWCRQNVAALFSCLVKGH